MSNIRLCTFVWVSVLVPAVLACDTSVLSTLPDGAGSAEFQKPDGIDPDNPNIERSTRVLDFEGVRTVRIEIPTGRVTVSQADDPAGASLKVTEVIAVEGLGHEVLAAMLTGSAVAAERSFVDPSRLDLKATVAEDLADADIAFDVRLVIPNGASLEIFLEQGPVDVTDVVGNVEIHTSDGAVVVDQVGGNVVATTTHRSIRALDVTGNVQAETSGGDITMRLAPPVDGHVSATTTEGDISLMIAEQTTANLSLVAQEGAVSADLTGFDVSDISTADGLLRGVLNGGSSGWIEARTTDGEITFLGM